MDNYITQTNNAGKMMRQYEINVTVTDRPVYEDEDISDVLF